LANIQLNPWTVASLSDMPIDQEVLIFLRWRKYNPWVYFRKEELQLRANHWGVLMTVSRKFVV